MLLIKDQEMHQPADTREEKTSKYEVGNWCQEPILVENRLGFAPT
jgi:hypothetical protein